MTLAALTDKNLLTYYESVRKEVMADTQFGGPFRLLGEGVKQYAAELQAEMTRRQIRFKPIQWR